MKLLNLVYLILGIIVSLGIIAGFMRKKINKIIESHRPGIIIKYNLKKFRNLGPRFFKNIIRSQHTSNNRTGNDETDDED
jgi:hypothetical protein